MPTYEYACTSCGERLEVVQKFSDDPLTVCPACAGALRKVFSPVGVVFKGSGFYKTDSRGAKKPATSEGAGKDKPATEAAGDGGGSTSTGNPADKPAAAKPDTSTPTPTAKSA